MPVVVPHNRVHWACVRQIREQGQVRRVENLADKYILEPIGKLGCIPISAASGMGRMGVSMVNNYRSQIASILDKSSYADLVKKIRATLAKGDNPAAEPNAPRRAAEKPSGGSP